MDVRSLRGASRSEDKAFALLKGRLSGFDKKNKHLTEMTYSNTRV